MFQLNFIDKKNNNIQTKTKQTNKRKKERKKEIKEERKEERKNILRGKMFNVQII